MSAIAKLTNQVLVLGVDGRMKMLDCSMSKRHGQLEAISALEPQDSRVITAMFARNEVHDTLCISYLANDLSFQSTMRSDEIMG